MATQYIVIHNKHEGCYDFRCYEDTEARMRITSITINPPKIYLFHTRDQAQDFFEEYMNDIDCLDIRCKKENDEIEHIECCTCGIIECDKNGDPILFYNKKNQIFLLEQKQQLFMPNFQLKSDISNMNLTNRLIHKVRRLDKEQRKKFIELGKYCQECDEDNTNNTNNTNNETESIQIKIEQTTDNADKTNDIDEVNKVINALKENIKIEEIEDEQTKQDIFNIMVKKANNYVEEQNKLNQHNNHSSTPSANSLTIENKTEPNNIEKKKKKTTQKSKEETPTKESKKSKESKKKASTKINDIKTDVKKDHDTK